MDSKRFATVCAALIFIVSVAGWTQTSIAAHSFNQGKIIQRFMVLMEEIEDKALVVGITCLEPPCELPCEVWPGGCPPELPGTAELPEGCDPRDPSTWGKCIDDPPCEPSAPDWPFCAWSLRSEIDDRKTFTYMWQVPADVWRIGR